MTELVREVGRDETQAWLEVDRLREENARLREAGQAVVDCFGVGLDSTQLTANIAYYVAGLAAALGDERATKALKVQS